ncbi:MAG: PQQ-binding-like beta-propeller repeat protein, partial [Anaerolineae bacterium]
MYQAKRPFRRPAIFVIILVSLVLAACGVSGTNDNWPGLSTDGEQVFVAYGDGVLAVDAATGEQVWSFPEEANPRLKFYAAPSEQDGRLFLGDYGASGGLLSPGIIVSVYALMDDGQGSPELLWQDSELVHDRIVAPMLQVGDQVIVSTANNFVYALDAESGDLNWQFETGHAIWGQPAYKGDTLFITSLDKSIYAVDVKTGQEKWQQTFSGAIAGAPVVNENLVYVANFDSKIHALDIETGAERWTAVAEGWIWGAPAYDNGELFYADAHGNV